MGFVHIATLYWYLKTEVIYQYMIWKAATFKFREYNAYYIC
jgi:hypothetical protein